MMDGGLGTTRLFGPIARRLFGIPVACLCLNFEITYGKCGTRSGLWVSTRRGNAGKSGTGNAGINFKNKSADKLPVKQIGQTTSSPNHIQAKFHSKDSIPVQEVFRKNMSTRKSAGENKTIKYIY